MYVSDNVNVIMIEAVGACNATCSYCPQGNGMIKIDKKDSLLSFDVLEKALLLAKMGKQRAIYLHHRGEPLIHPKIGKIINKVRDSGFNAYLSSNFISANERKIKEVLNNGLNQLEIHYTAGLTKRNHEDLLFKIHTARKLNWLLRNNGCKIEVNYALNNGEDESSVRKLMASKSDYYDESMYIRFYRPHDWPSLNELKDKGIKPEDCEWFKTKSSAILCNGDLVICCLDQFGFSKKVNIMDIDKIQWDHLTNRKICEGCVQQSWDMDWLRDDAINEPEMISRRKKIDQWM